MAESYTTQTNFDNSNPHAMRFDDSSTVTGSVSAEAGAAATTGATEPAIDAGTGTGKAAADFDSTGLPTKEDKPGLGDKMRGSVEVATGKVMNNPDLVEKGKERKAPTS